jgi:Flp pilus assembly protein TadG
MKARQTGLTTVEFAVTGAVALTVLIGAIEMGITLYVWNTIGEATRRAARLAVVCPINDPAIKQNALVVPSGNGTSSQVLPGLTPGNVSLSYLDATGAATTSYSSVAYVQVQISGYSQTLYIPFVTSTITVPPFTTTVPAESMGWMPDLGTRTCL